MFSKSDFFKSEYCCSIIKIGEVKPIEGKDKIGYTLVNGETIVVRKDQIKEGDVLFYASNETQLNKGFLGANNLFESDSYELNSNADTIGVTVENNRKAKKELDGVKKAIRNIKKCIELLTDKDTSNTEFKDERLKKYKHLVILLGADFTMDMSDDEFIANAQELLAKYNEKQNDLEKQIEDYTKFIRSNVGFFNKTGRVRAIRLGGIRSVGYLFTLEEIARWRPEVKDVDLNSLVGEDFDTVNDELFVKAYVPFVPERKSMSKLEKTNKKVERFDRMVKGEFSFHYDTLPFAKNMFRFKPEDMVTITYKLHGTSGIFAKVHVKNPIKLPFHQYLWNKFVDLTGLFKTHRITDYEIEYGNVSASRKVIKNQYINKEVTNGYYDYDLWTEYGDFIYPYLDEGMTLYGEICGYVTDSSRMIQSPYDYGCEVGKNFLMPYRITTANEDGTKREWSVIEVKEWTEKLKNGHPEIADKIRVIDLLYHGTLGALYPEISVTEHWNENLLEKLRSDGKRFFFEEDCFICKNKVPAEGVVLRIDNDDLAEAFKLKSERFMEKEAKQMDDIANGKAELSEEMAETYG